MKTADLCVRWLVAILLGMAVVAGVLHCEGVRLRDGALEWHSEQVPLEVLIEGRSVFVGLRKDISIQRGDNGIDRVIIRRRDPFGVRPDMWEEYESPDIVVQVYR